MAQIINIEKSKYINSNIAIYTSNKLGQYSKFLDKNPIFVKYYSINSAMSRTDVGTGGISDELGPNSPIRFNKISNFPVYNIPVLNPDINYDETGFDIDLDLNDWTILPNTIKPKPGDYLIVSLPGTKDFLFRINNYRFNTIQSNDFYQIDADLKDVGVDLETSRIASQIVESYETIFENIGTDNKCFIRSDDVPAIEAIAKIFLEMRDFYYNNFFHKVSGSFVLNDNEISPGFLFYDMYINKFIMDSEIYYTNNDPASIILSCNDIEPPNMDALFSRTLLYAVLNRSSKYLSELAYYYQRDITKPLSPFVLYDLDTKGVNLLISNNVIDPSANTDGFINYYYSNDLIKAIKAAGGYQTSNYLEEVIYNYMTNVKVEILHDKLIEYMIADNLYSYMYMPLVMYIVIKYYDSYFTKIEL
jgi:hypothetical protein